MSPTRRGGDRNGGGAPFIARSKSSSGDTERGLVDGSGNVRATGAYENLGSTDLGTASLGTIGKCGRVLDLFETDRKEWGATEVSDALDIGKSSAHALLSSLASIGLLWRTPNGRYRLGWRIATLHSQLLAANELLCGAKETMTALSERLGEAILLCVPSGLHIVVTESVGSTKVVQPLAAPAGTRLPAHSTAAGKVLLAAEPPERLAAMLSEASFAPLTSRTITEVPRLMAEIDEVRRTGIAYNVEERITEICAVSTGIRDYMGFTTAALSIVVPAYRFKAQLKVLEAEVLNAAQVISRRLGHTGARSVWR